MLLLATALCCLACWVAARPLRACSTTYRPSYPSHQGCCCRRQRLPPLHAAGVGLSRSSTSALELGPAIVIVPPILVLDRAAPSSCTVTPELLPPHHPPRRRAIPQHPRCRVEPWFGVSHRARCLLHRESTSTSTAHLRPSPPRSVLNKHQGDPVLLLDRLGEPDDLWSELSPSFPIVEPPRRVHPRELNCHLNWSVSFIPTPLKPVQCTSLMLLVLPRKSSPSACRERSGRAPPRHGCRHGWVPPLLRPWALRPGLAGPCCQSGLAQRHSSLFIFPFGLI
jgi:hypothetical protein